MKRYRIYKVLKWIFTVPAAALALYYIIGPPLEHFYFPLGNYFTTTAAKEIFDGILCGILAIFFKLQEDSNKPTAKE